MHTSEPIDYQCQLLDSHGRAVWRSRFYAPTDYEALEMARSFLRDRIDSACVFELRQGRRYIGCENDAVMLELGTTQATKLISPAAR